MLNRQIQRRATPIDLPPRISNDNNRLHSTERYINRSLQDFQRRSSNDNRRSPKPRNGRSALARVWKLPLKHPYLLPLTATAIYLYPANEGYYNTGSWTQYAKCPSPQPPPPFVKGWSDGANALQSQINSCLAGQAYTQKYSWSDVPDSSLSVIIAVDDRLSPFTDRSQLTEGWGRPSSGAFTPPDYQAFFAFGQQPLPYPYPQLQTAVPELLPILNAVPHPQPVPFRDLPDWQHPNRQVGNDVKPVLPSPSLISNEWSISHTVGSSRPRTAPRYHRVDRPPPHEREQKMRLPAQIVPLVKFVNFFSESIDVIDAIYQAVPSDKKPRYRDTPYEKLKPSPQEKLRSIYDNLGDINVADVMVNLAYEQIEDRLFGEIGRRNAEASKRLGLGYGKGLNTLTNKIGDITSSYAKF